MSKFPIARAAIGAMILTFAGTLAFGQEGQDQPQQSQPQSQQPSQTPQDPQQAPPIQQGQQEQQAQQQMTSQQEQQEVQVQGKIIGMKTADVGGMPHQLLHVQSDDGNRVIVDLGEKSKLENVALAEDQEIQISGTYAGVQDRQVLLANRITSEGQQTDIRQTRPVRLQGEIVAAQDVKVREADQRNRVVLLDTNRGRIAVDLGPSENLQNIQMAQGDQIRAEGHIVRVQDKPFLMASRFQTGDQQPMAIRRGVQLQTDGMQQQDQQGQQPVQRPQDLQSDQPSQGTQQNQPPSDEQQPQSGQEQDGQSQENQQVSQPSQL